MHGNVNGFILSLKIQISFMFQMNQFIQPSQCLNSVPQANAKADDYEIKGSTKKKGRGGETILITTRKHLFLNEVFLIYTVCDARGRLCHPYDNQIFIFLGLGVSTGDWGREEREGSSRKIPVINARTLTL